MILVAVMAFGFGIGLVVWDSGDYSEFCQTDGILTETPPGWELARDHENDCERTLFNQAQEKAPTEAYAGMAFGPPPPVPRDWSTTPGVVLVVTSTTGAAMIWVLCP